MTIAGLNAAPQEALSGIVFLFMIPRSPCPLRKCPVFTSWTSLDTTTVTGSLLFAASGCRLPGQSAEDIVLRVSRDLVKLLRSGVCRVLAVYGLFFGLFCGIVIGL